jgi:hypothetical protein
MSPVHDVMGVGEPPVRTPGEPTDRDGIALGILTHQLDPGLTAQAFQAGGIDHPPSFELTGAITRDQSLKGRMHDDR